MTFSHQLLLWVRRWVLNCTFSTLRSVAHPLPDCLFRRCAWWTRHNAFNRRIGEHTRIQWVNVCVRAYVMNSHSCVRFWCVLCVVCVCDVCTLHMHTRHGPICGKQPPEHVWKRIRYVDDEKLYTVADTHHETASVVLMAYCQTDWVYRENVRLYCRNVSIIFKFKCADLFQMFT